MTGNLTVQPDMFTARDWQRVDEGTVRLAMIGLGWWTRDEAIPAAEASQFCQPTTVVSGSSEKRKQTIDAHESVQHGLSYDAFHDGDLAEKYDAVYICTPNATHLEFVKTAAELDKAILCEKPMEASRERAERIVKIVEQHDVPLMVAYRMQTEPAVRRARDLISNGLIGTPVHVHGHMADNILELTGDPNQWRLDPDLSGGTTVNDLGIYPLNTTRFVLETDPVAVFATTRAEQKPFEGVDEHGTFQVEFEDGLTAACTVSHSSYGSSHLRFIGREGELTIEPVFFPWDDRELIYSRAGVTKRVSFEQINQMTEEFDYFADCILSGSKPYPDAAHGLVDMYAIDALYESAETGGRIELNKYF